MAGGACMVGGMWQGVCVVGGMCGRGCVWEKGLCGRGSMHGMVGMQGSRGMRGCGACMAGEMVTAWGGTLPTGMHSCSVKI